MEFSQICGDLLLKHLGSQMPHWGSSVSVKVPAPRLEALRPSLTCSAAACLTVSAGTPRVSGSSHCWWCCRCDSSAPARPVCCSAPRPSASSAPAPACAPENKPLTRQSSHLYPLSFSDSFFCALLVHLLSVVVLSGCRAPLRHIPVGADCFGAGSLLLLLRLHHRCCRSVCASAAGFWWRAFSCPWGFASLLLLR